MTNVKTIQRKKTYQFVCRKLLIPSMFFLKNNRIVRYIFTLDGLKVRCKHSHFCDDRLKIQLHDDLHIVKIIK